MVLQLKIFTVSIQKVLGSHVIVITVLLLFFFIGETKLARNNAIHYKEHEHVH